MGTQGSRPVFRLVFAVFVLILGGFLIWKLSSLVLPIIVGGLLAFLFRPVKERFGIPWLPHELQVLCSFAAIGLVLFFAFDTARKHVLDDKQRVEFKVRLKYKSNEKYQQLVTKSSEGKSSMLVELIRREVHLPYQHRLWLTNLATCVVRASSVLCLRCCGAKSSAG